MSSPNIFFKSCNHTKLVRPRQLVLSLDYGILIKRNGASAVTRCCIRGVELYRVITFVFLRREKIWGSTVYSVYNFYLWLCLRAYILQRISKNNVKKMSITYGYYKAILHLDIWDFSVFCSLFLKGDYEFIYTSNGSHCKKRYS